MRALKRALNPASLVSSCTKPRIGANTYVLAAMGDGGVGFLRRSRAAGLEGWRRLHDVPALRLWRGSSLPHGAGLQPQATPAGAGRPPQEEMQALAPTWRAEAGWAPEAG